MGSEEAQRFNIIVGGLLRAEASYRKISVVKLAALVEMERNTLTRYLNGERAIPLPILFRISEALGVKPERIIADATGRMTEA